MQPEPRPAARSSQENLGMLLAFEVGSRECQHHRAGVRMHSDNDGHVSSTLLRPHPYKLYYHCRCPQQGPPFSGTQFPHLQRSGRCHGNLKASCLRGLARRIHWDLDACTCVCPPPTPLFLAHLLPLNLSLSLALSLVLDFLSLSILFISCLLSEG